MSIKIIKSSPTVEMLLPNFPLPNKEKELYYAEGRGKDAEELRFKQSKVEFLRRSVVSVPTEERYNLYHKTCIEYGIPPIEKEVIDTMSAIKKAAQDRGIILSKNFYPEMEERRDDERNAPTEEQVQ